MGPVSYLEQIIDRKDDSAVHVCTFSSQYEPLPRIGGILHSHTFVFRVNQYANELPKVDFAALKKKLPAHTATLDALQV